MSADVANHIAQHPPTNSAAFGNYMCDECQACGVLHKADMSHNNLNANHWLFQELQMQAL